MEYSINLNTWPHIQEQKGNMTTLLFSLIAICIISVSASAIISWIQSSCILYTQPQNPHKVSLLPNLRELRNNIRKSFFYRSGETDLTQSNTIIFDFIYIYHKYHHIFLPTILFLKCLCYFNIRSSPEEFDV